jgi:hypothetical protein
VQEATQGLTLDGEPLGDWTVHPRYARAATPSDWALGVDWRDLLPGSDCWRAGVFNLKSGTDRALAKGKTLREAIDRLVALQASGLARSEAS